MKKINLQARIDPKLHEEFKRWLFNNKLTFVEWLIKKIKEEIES